MLAENIDLDTADLLIVKILGIERRATVLRVTGSDFSKRKKQKHAEPKL